VVTEISSPLPVASSVLVYSGISSASWPAGLGYGVLAATFACVLPFVAILSLVRARRLTDHHMGVRSQRALPLGIGVTSTAAGVAILVGLGAPRTVVSTDVAMLASLAAVLAVNLRWKASVHTAVVTGCPVLLSMFAGPAWLALALAVPVTGWSRVATGAHTPGETLAGAAVGGLVSTAMGFALFF
jgi:hypothetical protein